MAKKAAKFNVRKFIAERIAQIVKEYSRVACDQVRQQWSRHDVNGESEIGFTVEEAESIVTAHIVATGMKAWLLEYGKGSKMERNRKINPFLEEYISGVVTDASGDPLFNPKRIYHGLALIGRPVGIYADLDDIFYWSHGRFDNRNIEAGTAGITNRWEQEPMPPRLIIRNILFGQDGKGGIVGEVNKEIHNAFAEALSNIFAEFPTEIVIRKE